MTFNASTQGSNTDPKFTWHSGLDPKDKDKDDRFEKGDDEFELCLDIARIKDRISTISEEWHTIDFEDVITYYTKRNLPFLETLLQEVEDHEIDLFTLSVDGIEIKPFEVPPTFEGVEKIVYVEAL
jgi:hypothetical protein